MYFVRLGERCIRYSGQDDWDEDDLPELTAYFNFDDEKEWPLDELQRKSLRVSYGAEEWDEDALAAVNAELNRRKHVEEPETYDDWDDVVEALEEDAEEDFEDFNPDHRPLVFVDDISLLTRKLIKDVAKVEQDELAFRKENVSKGLDVADMIFSMDDEAMKKSSELQERGWKAREALMNSDLGQAILDMYDPIEDMKDMAAQMLFLYAQDRMRAETSGGKPDEDYFYAGYNLYSHAAVAQMAYDEDDEYYEDDDDDEDDD